MSKYFIYILTLCAIVALVIVPDSFVLFISLLMMPIITSVLNRGEFNTGRSRKNIFIKNIIPNIIHGAEIIVVVTTQTLIHGDLYFYLEGYSNVVAALIAASYTLACFSLVGSMISFLCIAYATMLYNFKTAMKNFMLFFVVMILSAVAAFIPEAQYTSIFVFMGITFVISIVLNVLSYNKFLKINI